MNRLTTYVFLALAVALAGCGSTVTSGTPPREDAGTIVDTRWEGDLPLPPPDAPMPIDIPLAWDAPPLPMDSARGCTEDHECTSGQRCLGGEGCDVPRTCRPGGTLCFGPSAAFCGCDGHTFYSSRYCPARSFAHYNACHTDPPDGMPGVNADCILPSGGVCRANETCPIDACTTCSCSATTELRCTTGCVDGGAPRACESTADCPPGNICSGSEGCATPWTCQPFRACSPERRTFCACDGNSFEASANCPGRPFLHPGGCGPVVDAGVVEGGVVDAGSDDAGFCTINGVTCTVGVGCRINECTNCLCGGDMPMCAWLGCVPDAGGDAGLRPCPAQDARGVGACAILLGYAWNGASCVGVSGCSCAGADCHSLPIDRAPCERDHLTCPRPG